MKRILLAITLMAGALSLLWVGVVQAANVRTGQSPMVMSNETIDGTLYAAGGNITIDGTIEGDLICAGSVVQVNGTVQGDILCAAQNIVVKGTVEGDVRTIAQGTTLDGKVNGSVTLVGQNASLAATAQVGRDATLVAQYATADGKIGRDLSAMGSDFKVTGNVGRDLEVTGQFVSLGSNSVVNRNFTYTSQQDARLENGARVNGTTDHRFPERDENQIGDMAAAYAGSVVFGFAGLLIVGLALLLLLPRLMAATSQALQHTPLSTLGYGVIGFIVPPFIAMVLAITFIGVPLAFVMILAWLALLIVAMAFTAQGLGELLLKKLHWQGALQHITGLLLGLLVLFLLALIPVIGTFIAFVAILWGIGAFWYVVLKGMRGSGDVAVEPVTADKPKKTPAKAKGAKKK